MNACCLRFWLFVLYCVIVCGFLYGLVYVFGFDLFGY